MTLRFALTPGEPAGIGPDLCLMLAHEVQPYPVIAISNRTLLTERAALLGLQVELIDVQPGAWPDKPAAADSLYVWDTPLYEPVV
ncbi:MAG: 4-hydroxythreonine-4-phosphate dehydrogenase PdxA, partial [Pseudomonas sp.]|nr:4-hydroxythreonine-4-phosphate dehydrogenase PdxA [Pseudomonas sp.]